MRSQAGKNSLSLARLRALSPGDVLVAATHAEVLITAEEVIELVPNDLAGGGDDLIEAGPTDDRIPVGECLVVHRPQDLGEQGHAPYDVAEVAPSRYDHSPGGGARA
jgi:hypothetical protein